ncbi:MAG: hypothetical protein J7J28_04675 [Thaumarchaeota archaeon]|nr:hypothetical protein [Nitrososphaerota archaeon]
MGMEGGEFRKVRLLLTHYIEHVDEHIRELRELEKRIGLKEVNALIESSISDFSHGRDKLKRALSILSEE